LAPIRQVLVDPLGEMVEPYLRTHPTHIWSIRRIEAIEAIEAMKANAQVEPPASGNVWFDQAKPAREVLPPEPAVAAGGLP
jgi:hypothetical protein